VAIGWSTFPLAYTCFRHFPDRGFAMAKTQGSFLISYLIWISTSLGLTHYHRYSISMIVFGYLVLNLILLITQFDRILWFVKTHLKLLLLVEGIFFLFFLTCVVIRMYNPDLTGAEKEADFTFLNAILHSKTFPPKDTWFAGTPINYYYFGYLIWATAIKVTGIYSPVGFNLALATIVALSAAGIFGLVYFFTQRVSYSLLSSFFLTILGNLDGLVQFLRKSSLSPFYRGEGSVFPFDWWRSSRVIPDTINEFPYFSFLLGDLHAHFMAIPFVLLLLGLLSQFVSYFFKDGHHLQGDVHLVKKREILYPWILLAFISLSIGGAAVINGWDYPTYLIIAGLCVGIAVLRSSGTVRFGEHNVHRVLITLCMFGFLIVFSRLFFLPFYRHFSPQLNFSNLRFVASIQRTGIGYFLVIYGFFLWIIFSFFYCRFPSFFSGSSEQEKNVKVVGWNSILLFSALGYVFFSTWVFPVACIISGVFLYLLYKKCLSIPHPASSIQQPTSSTPHPAPRTLHPAPRIPYLFLFMAFAIIAGCEIIYIKDFYGHPLERQNTIFKFYYQAWILLSIGTPYLLYLISQSKDTFHRHLKRAWNMMFVLLCAACCIYPILATYEKTNHFRGQAQGGLLYIPTLNGISYIAYRNPYEYEALMWIQEHTDEDVVILEATKDPYSFFGRVASTTGRSTVLGWGNHEALWRDQTWKSIIQRTNDIKQIYETVDKQNIIKLLEKYQITYIYVGELEKQVYNSEGLEAFDSYFQLVFENLFVRIYKMS
jgi:YYY domain-containing protein